jgi:hypothetical protein|tara:strand:+ start:24 stop:1961 length:1938 start_codon:yes stop_codon:yes gene_type:complete
MKTFKKFTADLELQNIFEGYDISVTNSTVNNFTTKIDKKKIKKLLSILKSSGQKPAIAPLDVWLAGDEKGNIKIRNKSLPKTVIKQIKDLGIPYKLGNGSLDKQKGDLKDPVGGPPRSTDYYEQWQSIGLLSDIKLTEKDCLAAMKGNATVAKSFKTAYKKLNVIGGGTDFVDALDHPIRLGDAGQLVLGSLKLRDGHKIFSGSYEVVWADIDTYYSHMIKYQSHVVTPNEKENTADAVVISGFKLDALTKEGLKFKPLKDATIEVFDGKKKLGSLLQVSMKKSHKDARLGKIKDVFKNQNWGTGDNTGLDLSGYVGKVFGEDVELKDMYLSEGLLDIFKSVGSKISSFAKKLLSKVKSAISVIGDSLKKLANKLFNPKKLEKDSESYLDKYVNKALNESVELLDEAYVKRVAKHKASKGKLKTQDKIEVIVNTPSMIKEIISDLNSEVDSIHGYIKTINKKKNSEFKNSVCKYTNPKKPSYDTVRQLIMNHSSLSVSKDMVKSLAAKGKAVDYMVETFVGFMKSAYMGNTQLPIVKLFGVSSPSEKAWEIFNLQFFDDKQDELIDSLENKKFPTGGLKGEQKAGEAYAVFYLYTIAGMDESTKTPVYNVIRLTSMGGLSFKIEAESEINLPKLEKAFVSAKCSI